MAGRPRAQPKALPERPRPSQAEAAAAAVQKQRSEVAVEAAEPALRCSGIPPLAGEAAAAVQSRSAYCV